MKILLFNSLTRQKQAFEPLQPGKVQMYHCGPTVYSSPHIGNFRAFLLADLLRRVFEDQGLSVLQVMNITDVGHMTADDEDAGADKMEEAAKREQLDPWAIAAKYTEEFEKCLVQLCFLRPHELPRATDFIAEMGAIIEKLLHAGYAYQVNGNVYFEIAKFPAYGKLSKKVIDELEQGARVAVNLEKRNPRDFALWKTDAKHLMQWDAPFKGGARGFPGWHIECSAMSMKYLGETLDFHGGGEDLIFPHHENEIAQSECATGHEFVRFWLHNGLLNLRGEKMSKSTGHFFAMDDVLREFSGDVVRFYLLSTHFRSQSEFSHERLREAARGYERLVGACRIISEHLERLVDATEVDTPGGKELESAAVTAREGFLAAMDDDFNSAGAIGQMFELVKRFNVLLDQHGPGVARSLKALDAVKATIHEFDQILGLFPNGFPVAAEEIPAEITKMVEDRQNARKDKDFQRADEIRDAIIAAGYTLEDTPEGVRIRPI